jgi:TRAP-type C4-dicarboxylate transport system permease small subunit
MRSLDAADRWLGRFYGWCGYVAAALLVVLGVLVVLSILTRLAGTYVPGLTEYSGYAMAGASFFALAYTFRERGHIRVGILLNALHGRAHWLLEVWCHLVATFFSGFLAYYLVKMTRVSWQLGDRSEGADAILLWIPQTMVAFGSMVLALCVAHSLIKVVFGGPAAEQRAGPSGVAGEP